MDNQQTSTLARTAAKIRRHALEAVYAAKSGHIGGSFSVADILTVLFFDKMRIDPSNPEWEDRDRFVLSKGHCTPALYAALALKGYFPLEDLRTFRNIDSYLSGHAEMRRVPGVDMSTGSLGQGLSAAAGIALAGKQRKRDYFVYAVLGDGEIQEGQIWEAAMAAGHYKLHNLIAFVDNNNLQIDGALEEVLSPYPIADKFKAFHWNTMTVDGHNHAQIAEAVDKAVSATDRPTVIIARTIKGKGVSFMENNVDWHGKTPSEDQFAKAFEELDAALAKWEER